MYKTLSLAVALLIGLVSSKHSVMDYHRMMTFGSDKYVSGSYGLAMDLNYHTEYQGGQYAEAIAVPSPDHYKYKSYALSAEATVDLMLDTQWFDFYQANYDVTFTPAKITPYQQWVIWYRPVSDGFSFDNFDVNFFANWRADVL